MVTTDDLDAVFEHLVVREAAPGALVFDEIPPARTRFARAVFERWPEYMKRIGATERGGPMIRVEVGNGFATYELVRYRVATDAFDAELLAFHFEPVAP